MPSKKKKYNARFPAGRIKKIMQTDEEVGKVAQAVPVIISRTLELFIESLITKSVGVTKAKNARTLSPQHMKICILSESRFDFLKDLVKSVPEVATSDDDNWNDTTSAQRRVSVETRCEKDDEMKTEEPETPAPRFYIESQAPTNSSNTNDEEYD